MRAWLVAAGMATTNTQGTSNLTLRNGCRCVPEPGVTVEEMLLIIGDKIGFDSIVSASRMNKAVVVFLKSEALVNELTVSGIWVKETFVPVTPLSAPATKVIVSNAPPFISNEAIVKELLRFGKIASPVKAVPLGCKDAALKHVLSFRRMVYMFLSSPERTLEASFRVTHGESSFMVYASSESLRCFECGDLGHKRFSCPKKSEVRASTSRADDNNSEHHVNIVETPRYEEQDNGATEEVEGQQEVSDSNVNHAGCVEQPGGSHLPDKDVSASVDDNVGDAEDKGMNSDVVQVVGSQEKMDDEFECLSQCTDDGMKDDEWPEMTKEAEKDLYSVEQINSFLDQTKGKSGVEISDYFPDTEKFIVSAMRARKVSSYEELTQQKRYRLKKHVTNLGKKLGKARGKFR